MNICYQKKGVGRGVFYFATSVIFARFACLTVVELSASISTTLYISISRQNREFLKNLVFEKNCLAVENQKGWDKFNPKIIFMASYLF